jgi:hypothetical protein
MESERKSRRDATCATIDKIDISRQIGFLVDTRLSS